MIMSLLGKRPRQKNCPLVFSGAAEGSKEDKESWLEFLRHLKERGLSGTQLFVGDKCLRLVEALGEVFPQAKWQRYVVHFYQNVFSVVPHGKMKEVAEKAKAVARKLREMKLSQAAEKVGTGIEETLTYMNFPREYLIKIRTNNGLERIMREIRRRTRVVGCFPDGKSALMLVCARLRHITTTNWVTKRYMNMGLLVSEQEVAVIG
mgnify:CR=1 FL=1